VYQFLILLTSALRPSANVPLLDAGKYKLSLLDESFVMAGLNKLTPLLLIEKEQFSDLIKFLQFEICFIENRVVVILFLWTGGVIKLLLWCCIKIFIH